MLSTSEVGPILAFIAPSPFHANLLRPWRFPLNSYIVPIFKSGDPLDPNNYRGISLLNGIAKLFSAILNNRIMIHMRDKFSNVQFGFRTNLRTTDSLFLFKTLINK